MKSPQRPPRRPRIGIVSLGCPKALVDSERILTRLHADGYDLTGSGHAADLVLVNTCGFIDSAREESLEAIDEALAANGRVLVTGCLGAEAETIRERFPGVLAVTGPHQYDAVVDAVHAHLPPPASAPACHDLPDYGLKLTPPHYAYLKISEGCNHKCRFCIIPTMRGGLVSRSIDDVLSEAEALAAGGVQELLVISQDTSAYGSDLGYARRTWQARDYQTRMLDLCRALGELGVWVRLHYVYPYPHVDDVIPLMREGGLLPYLDVPFQHGSNRILKLMRRPAAAEDTLARIASWRRHCPDLAIRSTFIVGFPGETEEDFEALLAFLKAAELDRVGCFTYSPVAGAAANALPDPVPAALAEERRRRLHEVQSTISGHRLARQVGHTREVLIDNVNGDTATGRSYLDAPEIDGVVTVTGCAALSEPLEPGDILRTRITAAGEHDLAGEPAWHAAGEGRWPASSQEAQPPASRPLTSRPASAKPTR